MRFVFGFIIGFFAGGGTVAGLQSISNKTIETSAKVYQQAQPLLSDENISLILNEINATKAP